VNSREDAGHQALALLAVELASALSSCASLRDRLPMEVDRSSPLLVTTDQIHDRINAATAALVVASTAFRQNPKE